MMIDKVEVIVSHDANFGKKFRPVFRELRGNPQFGPFRPSRHFRAVADLRKLLGLDAIAHVEQKRYGTHKFELLDTGKKSMNQFCHILEELVDADPMTHRVSRIDLAVDVPGLSLPWFRDYMRVQFKQWLCAHGKFRFEEEFSEMGRKVYQTLYFGKRPSCIRVYDKVAERSQEYEQWKKRELRESKRAALEEVAHLGRTVPPLVPEFPSFEQWFAVELAYSLPSQAELPGMEQPQQLSFPVVTRVENQLGGRVPAKLNTLAAVVRNVRDFNPFARVHLTAGTRKQPPGLYDRNDDGSYQHSVMQWMAGMWLREHYKDFGSQGIAGMLNRDRNGKRLLDSLGAFIPADDERGVTSAELYERFRETVSRQLAA